MKQKVINKSKNQQTKFVLSNIFGSLIKNERAISAAKNLPWWSAIIVFLIATFIPVIPLMVNVAKSSGEDFVSNITYSLDRDITAESIALNNENKTFIVNSDHMLEYYVNNVKTEVADDSQPIARYVNNNENQYELDFYFSTRDYSGLNELIAAIKKIQYKKGGFEMRPADGSGEDKDYYIPSFIVFHSDGMIINIYKHNTITQASAYVGDWQKTEVGTNVINRVLTVEGFAIPTSLEEMEDAVKYIDGSFKNWKAIFVEGYETRKGQTLLYNTLIYLGIYMGLVLFLGLLIFILTRGKRNLNRYLKWYQCMGISMWASLAPGILSLILGFIIPNYAVMFFILFEGVRVMWLTMKQLAPSQQTR